jgi:hypothetical protein
MVLCTTMDVRCTALTLESLATPPSMPIVRPAQPITLRNFFCFLCVKVKGGVEGSPEQLDPAGEDVAMFKKLKSQVQV